MRGLTTRRAGTLLAVLAIVLVAWMGTHGVFSREPRFMGEPFTLSLDKQVPGAVMKEVGTSGIPTLLRMICAKDHAVGLRIWINERDWLPSGLKLPPPDGGEKHRLAVLGFEGLGTNAASAVPQLLKIYERTPESQIPCIQALGAIGTAAKEALPTLLIAVTNFDSDIGCAAMLALGAIHSQPENVVPVLVKAATNAGSLNVERSALTGLRGYGTQARDIAPFLLDRIHSFDNEILRIPGKTTNATAREMMIRGYRAEQTRYLAIL